jgi:O-antigen/teichoic acid export membrane protein
VVFLGVWGRPFILRWVGPEFAAHSAPLLPVFLLSNVMVLAAQFNSSSILFGLGRHGGYARGLVVEAVLYVSGLVLVVPRFGILGAACVSAVFMILVRGLYTPWLVCHALDYSFLAYMRGIYVRPLLTAVPALALAWLLKTNGIPGRTWPELLLAGVVCGLLYAVPAYFTCVVPEHRALLLSRIPVLGPRLVSRRA